MSFPGFECRSERNPARAFHSRAHAGSVLAELCAPALDAGAVLVALGRGGLDVARALHRGSAPVPVACVAAITAPWSAELCVGAAAFDGSVCFDERMVSELGLERRQLAGQVELTRARIAGDEVALTAPRPTAASGSAALLVSDGLPGPAELRVAAAALATLGYRPVSLAIATGHWRDLRSVEDSFDRVYCGDVRRSLASRAIDAYASTDDEGETSGQAHAKDRRLGYLGAGHGHHASSIANR